MALGKVDYPSSVPNPADSAGPTEFKILGAVAVVACGLVDLPAKPRSLFPQENSATDNPRTGSPQSCRDLRSTAGVVDNEKNRLLTS